MHASRLLSARSIALLFVLSSLPSATRAEPKNYVLTGKFTSNRGLLINIPMFATVPCAGAGLSNLTVMAGPGGVKIPAPYTPPTRTTMTANPFGCVGNVPGKKISTSGAGVGGAFVLPTKILSRPFQSYVPAIGIHEAPLIQLATSFKITGPLMSPTTPRGGSMVTSFPPAAWHSFKKGAWRTQTGRQGSMFTWCLSNPSCVHNTEGDKGFIVKYAGGGNAFGGTMAYVITARAGASSLAVGAAGGAVGFAQITGTGSQPSGRGYASSLNQRGEQGPLWAAYKTMTVTRPNLGKQKLITMVTGYLGKRAPALYNYNWGFPWTTMTVLARHTGTQLGIPVITTLTAKGGDSASAMGKRNLSLVAGGISRTIVGPLVSQYPEIAQMYLPESGRTAQLVAGVLGLLAVAAIRARLT